MTADTEWRKGLEDCGEDQGKSQAYTRDRLSAQGACDMYFVLRRESLAKANSCKDSHASKGLYG